MRWRARNRFLIPWMVVPALAGAIRPAACQILQGRLLDERTEAVVANGAVFLLDRDGEVKARSESDTLGRFLMRVPEPGEYAVVAERLGYERARTPLLRIDRDDLPPLDLLMRPEAIGLEGLEVTVDAMSVIRTELARAGVRLALVPDERVVTRAEILRRQGAVDPGAILSWQSVSGLTVRRQENASAGHEVPLCVLFARGRTATGLDRCAMVVIDGVPDPGARRFSDLPAHRIEAMVLLTPLEAEPLFGGDGEGGAVLVFTRAR